MRPFPLDQLFALSDALARTWWKPLFAKRRDALMLGCCLAGMRSVEMLNLKVPDVQYPINGSGDDSDYTIFVHTAKGGQPRTIPMGISWTTALREFCRLNYRGLPSTPAVKAGFLWLTNRGERVSYEHINRTCKRWTTKLTGRPYTLHCFRHTAAIHCYRESGDVLKVQRLLGHKSLMHTAVYLASLEVVDVPGMAPFINAGPGKPRPPLTLYAPPDTPSKPRQGGHQVATVHTADPRPNKRG